ncbi:MAG: transcriptional repressor LexA [Spirochaetales bacterium]|nr:transcriptional repressor LexA [Spirochaetales bacterium]
MKKLTQRQKEVVDFVAAYIEDHHYPPTIREIARNFEISVKGAYDHIKALEKKGAIKSGASKSRALELLTRPAHDSAEEIIDVPILGSVAAGLPLFAEENQDGALKVPASNLSRGEHFALIVKGDSMIDAGILDGDTAVFVKRQTASDGDIVVARVNDEAVTLKRFYKEKNRVRLQAENHNYPPLYTQNARILGKLEYIFRQYG